MNIDYNTTVTIKCGALSGHEGTVTEYYSIEREYAVQIDPYTTVITAASNIKVSEV